MAKQPMAEVFGFPIDNMSAEAERYRGKRLCPFNNHVPNCTKDTVENPLGVCSVFDGRNVAITCPVRFRQDWRIADDAAAFFFSPETKWTSLTEVRLNDSAGKPAGNIDVILVAYDDAGNIIDFGALEVQAVYISGNIRKAFMQYVSDPVANAQMDWSGQRNYPRPDYLSSSRKRLAPQLLFKGGIIHAWQKKQAVAVDQRFFATLPPMEEVPTYEADLTWLIYDLQFDTMMQRYQQKLVRTVYTQFQSALDRITLAVPGNAQDFIAQLQKRLLLHLTGNETSIAQIGEVSGAVQNEDELI